MSDIGTACWFLPSRCVVVVRVVTVTATTFEVDSDACCCSRLEGFGSIYGCSAIIPCSDSPVGHPIVTMTWCQTTLCSVLAASEADGACGGDSSARQLEAGAQSSGSVPVAAADAGIQVKHRLLLMFRSTRARQAMRVQRPVFYIARLLWLCLRLCRAGARSLTVPAPSSRAADRRPFNGHTVIVPSSIRWRTSDSRPCGREAFPWTPFHTTRHTRRWCCRTAACGKRRSAACQMLTTRVPPRRQGTQIQPSSCATCACSRAVDTRQCFRKCACVYLGACDDLCFWSHRSNGVLSGRVATSEHHCSSC